MKVKYIYIKRTGSDDKGELICEDGGVACFHHNEENLIVTLYQSRLSKEDRATGFLNIDSLSDGHVYLKDVPAEMDDEVSEKTLQEAAEWLCSGASIDGYDIQTISEDDITEAEIIKLFEECQLPDND